MKTDYLIPVLVFVAVLLAVSAIYLLVSSQRLHRKQVSRRLANTRVAPNTHSELARVRRDRSLTAEGNYTLPIISLNQLILQSGVTVGIHGILFTMLFLFAGAFVSATALFADRLIAVVIGVVVGLGVPLLFLKSLRDARRRKFEELLPDAIDVFVRGLRAGHAIPVAISTVGKQMPEPVGGEFALTAAELTYGLDLETAMVNLRSRVGQSDLSLIVLAVSIQAKLGGNLAEILGKLSHVIRERFKLRRKAKALSAEGRYSALFLSIMPVLLFGILWVISPTYYGQVWNEPIVKPILGASVAWMMIGNIIMYRMVRFSI